MNRPPKEWRPTGPAPEKRDPAAGGNDGGLVAAVLLAAGALVCAVLTFSWYGDWQNVHTLTLWFGSSSALAGENIRFALLTVAGAAGTVLLAVASWRSYHRSGR
jgi:hypothetical protein